MSKSVWLRGFDPDIPPFISEIDYIRAVFVRRQIDAICLELYVRPYTRGISTSNPNYIYKFRRKYAHPNKLRLAPFMVQLGLWNVKRIRNEQR